MSAVDLAREALSRKIATGEWTCGQRLPSELELSVELGVSRGSLREAQKMLMVAGVLEAEQGSRPRVSDMSADKLMTALRMVVPMLPLERLLELYPLRELLESHAVIQATARMGAGELAELATLARELAGLSVRDARMEAMDQEFHLRIIEGAEDDMILALLRTIHQRGLDYHILRSGEDQGVKEQSDRAHLELVIAMEARDPRSAENIMRRHIRDSARWLKQLHPTPRPGAVPGFSA